MKIACLTPMMPDYRLDEAFELLSALGYTGIEIGVGYPKALWDASRQWHVGLDELEESVPNIVGLVEKYSLPVINIASVMVDEEKQLELCRFASMLGCKMVRLASKQFMYCEDVGYDKLFTQSRECLSRLVDRTGKLGVKLLVETHQGNITPSGALARRFVEGFDPERVGVIWDPANQLVEGGESPALSLDLLGQYLAHVHVKNSVINRSEAGWGFEYVPFRQGMIDWKEIVRLLRKRGYDGWFSIEDFYGGYCVKPKGTTTDKKLAEDIADLCLFLAE